MHDTGNEVTSAHLTHKKAVTVYGRHFRRKGAPRPEEAIPSLCYSRSGDSEVA